MAAAGTLCLVRPEDYWRGAPVWTAVRIGIPAAVLFGLIQFALQASATRALSAGIAFGVLFGPAMALFSRRAWRRGGELHSEDRVAAVRAVRRGEAVHDPRLARAVTEYASVVKSSAARDRKYNWLLWIFALGTLILAAAATIDGPAHAAIVWWVLFVVWVVLLVRLPRMRARNLEKAARAEAAAERLLGEGSDNRP